MPSPFHRRYLASAWLAYWCCQVRSIFEIQEEALGDGVLAAALKAHAANEALLFQEILVQRAGILLSRSK